MRRNQVDMLLIAFDGEDASGWRRERRVVSVYADSNDVWQALAHGFGAFAEMSYRLAVERDPGLAELAGGGRVYLRCRLQRFLDAVPDGYPKDNQVVAVELVADEPFAAVEAAHAALVDELRRHEAILAGGAAATVRTNIDEVDPLVGDAERMRQRAQRAKEHAESREEQGDSR